MLHATVNQTKERSDGSRVNSVEAPHAGLHPTRSTGRRRSSDLAIKQKTFGNQALLRMLGRNGSNGSPLIQHRRAGGDSPPGRAPQNEFRINAPGDVFEQEADRVATEVMRTENRYVTPRASGSLQRKCAACEEEETELQRKENGEANGAAPAIVHEVLGAPGTPLDSQARAFFEPRFGLDLSHVRVHLGGRAAESARAIDALAYTVGRNIVFDTAQYRPDTNSGRCLLAHELTHVVQQGAGERRVQRRTPGGDVVATDAGAQALGAGTTAGGAGTSACTVPDDCPQSFCTPWGLPKKQVELLRDTMAPNLLAGIVAFVDPRVEPVWKQHLYGGATPHSFTSSFAADFTRSTTTDDATGFLQNALVESLKASPPLFPPGMTVTTIDIPTRIPKAIKALGTPNVPGAMNFSAKKEIPGNLAGDIGKDQAACPGRRPTFFHR